MQQIVPLLKINKQNKPDFNEISELAKLYYEAPNMLPTVRCDYLVSYKKNLLLNCSYVLARVHSGYITLKSKCHMMQHAFTTLLLKTHSHTICSCTF